MPMDGDATRDGREVWRNVIDQINLEKKEKGGRNKVRKIKARFDLFRVMHRISVVPRANLLDGLLK